MSSEKGKMMTCDRCKKQEFIKAIADGEADGGYTKYNRFEKNEWHREYGCDLCPACYSEYRGIVEDFFSFKEVMN